MIAILNDQVKLIVLTDTSKPTHVRADEASSEPHVTLPTSEWWLSPLQLVQNLAFGFARRHSYFALPNATPSWRAA
jgi:hypothetical protein